MASAKPLRSTRVLKKEQVVKLLRRPNGASMAELGKITGWQDHSIRGFLSGTLKKRLGLEVESFKDKKGVRRYRILNSIEVTSVKPVKVISAKPVEEEGASQAQSTIVA